MMRNIEGEGAGGMREKVTVVSVNKTGSETYHRGGKRGGRVKTKSMYRGG